MKRTFTAALATFLLIFAATWLWVAKERMAFFDISYAGWRAKMDFAKTLPKDNVVILGDSRAVAGLVPSVLGPSVYNLALAGCTSIEAAKWAHDLTASATPPRAVILSFTPVNLMATKSFWETTAKCGFLTRQEIETVWERARQFNGREYWPEGESYARRSSLAGPKSPGDIEIRMKADLYAEDFPPCYFSALWGGRIIRRLNINRKFYHETYAARGYYPFGTADECAEAGLEAQTPSFQPVKLFDLYLRESLALFEGSNIPVYFVSAPVNAATTPSPEYTAAFCAYIARLEAEFHNFHSLGTPQPTWSAQDFGDDFNHLRPPSAVRWSKEVAQKLNEEHVPGGPFG